MILGVPRFELGNVNSNSAITQWCTRLRVLEPSSADRKDQFNMLHLLHLLHSPVTEALKQSETC